MGRLGKSAELQQRFIADASHQLRTPLTGLKAQVEFAMRLKDEAEIRHSLQQMYKATEHAAHLVNQLLSLARVEPSVRISDNLIDLDLAALARTTTEHWVQPALKKNIDLGLETDGDVCTIKGNSLLLVEMLNNLIDNALRYTQPNGHVTVRIMRDATAFRLEVEDNGRGIPENERMRVFERFYRVLGSNQDGCGLGLSIVREIAHRHDAEVHVLSGADGNGTLMRVTFKLP
jgi:two-component system sensor histidine kinase TctE